MAPTEVVNPSITDTRFYKYTLPPIGPRFDLIHIPDDCDLCILQLVTINNTLLILGMRDAPRSSASAVVDFCLEVKIE